MGRHMSMRSISARVISHRDGEDENGSDIGRAHKDIRYNQLKNPRA